MALSHLEASLLVLSVNFMKRDGSARFEYPVLILLAAWLVEPSWLAWAKHTDRHFMPLVILVVFVVLLAIKWRQHRSDREPR